MAGEPSNRTVRFTIFFVDDHGRVVQRGLANIKDSRVMTVSHDRMHDCWQFPSIDLHRSVRDQVIVSATDGRVIEINRIDQKGVIGAFFGLPSFPPLHASTASPKVPSAAETLVSYVCTPDRLEAVLGDLERNFTRRAAKHGERAARRWYWWQTVRTVVVFGVQIVVKVVLLRELLRKFWL